MTRLAHYQLYSCPLCETVYKHPLWASVSIYVPESVNPYLARVCQKCEFQAPLDGWTEAGIVQRYTPEELERRGALAMEVDSSMAELPGLWCSRQPKIDHLGG